MIADLLKESGGPLRLQYHVPARGGPAGLWFLPDSPCATGGAPNLFLFPPPYHPLEVLMAQRGFGGRIRSPVDTDALREIERARTRSLSAFCEEASKWLFKSAGNLMALWHLFTPYHTRYTEWEQETERLRPVLYKALGSSGNYAIRALLYARKSNQATNVHDTYFGEFWTFVANRGGCHAPLF